MGRCYHFYVFLEPKMERNDEINPFWIEDRDLKKGPVAFLSTAENQFWKELLEKYLFPIDEDKAEKVMCFSCKFYKNLYNKNCFI